MTNPQILVLPKGARESWYLDVTEDASPYAAIDLTGVTVKMRIRRTWQDAVFLEKTLVAYDAPNGIMQVDFVKADTNSLANMDTDFVFDVIAFVSSGGSTDEIPLCRGKLTVTPSSIT